MNWQDKVEQLNDHGLSLRVEKNGEALYTSEAPRLKPLFACILEQGDAMQGSVVIDKVIGRAAALLCAHAGVSAVITPLASEPAKSVLAEYDIPLYAEKIIPRILNQKRTDLCPMEKMSLNFDSPEAFFNHLSGVIQV